MGHQFRQEKIMLKKGKQNRENLKNRKIMKKQTMQKKSLKCVPNWGFVFKFWRDFKKC